MKAATSKFKIYFELHRHKIFLYYIQSFFDYNNSINMQHQIVLIKPAQVQTITCQMQYTFYTG